MSFEMALPHPPRLQHVAADGTEQLAQDEQQWALYFTVQRSLEQEAAGEAAGAGEADAAGEESKPAAAAAPQPVDPQKVLERLTTARAELDVVADLITFVEQQQFLAVEGVHRHPAGLDERLRARSLRLAGSRAALRGAAGALGAGLAALRARADVEGRFLADLLQLRRRWVLRRHAGPGALFFVDLALPLRGPAARALPQDGALCNIVQDTNGDACMVEADAAGRRRAVRGWRHIHAVLHLKQLLLAWRLLRGAVEAAARLPVHEADADRGVAAVLRLAGGAAAACQAALADAVAGSAEATNAMDVDGGGPAAAAQQAPEGAAAAAAQQAPEGAAAAAAAAPGGLPPAMLGSTALDILDALASPGFRQLFEARALRELAALLPGGGAGGGGAGGGPQRCDAVLDGLLRWLRHTALCLRVGASLQSWRDARPGRQLRRVATGEEFAAVWRLDGFNRANGVAAAAAGAGAAEEAAAPLPLLVVVHGGSLRVEGAGGGVADSEARVLSRTEFERLLQTL